MARKKAPKVCATTLRYPDWQRTRLYNSEGSWAEMYEWDELDIHECRAFVKKVTHSKWWKQRGGYRDVQVKDGRGTTRAQAYGRMAIGLPRGMRSKWVILHELAHTLVPYPRPGHGRRFVQVYIDLVHRFLGKEYAQSMRKAFREDGLKWAESKAKYWQ